MTRQVAGDTRGNLEASLISAQLGTERIDFLEELGITCFSVDVGHIGKAAGSIGCLTGVVEREGS